LVVPLILAKRLTDAPPVEPPQEGPNLKQVSLYAKRNPLPITAGEPAP
jgi:hypothetical protein